MSMRTLAATFDTKEEAEAACRRLEAIGIGRDRIILKDVARAAEGSPQPGPSAGVFISLKVTTEQVEPVNEILKGNRTPDEAPAPRFQGLEREALLQTPKVPEPAPPPLPSVTAEPASAAPGHAPPAPRPRAAQPGPQDWPRLGRYLILYGLVLVAAFMIGAWLGMLS
jgi:hypothetical protein